MELKIFENGIQSHNQVIHRALLKNGLYVMHEKGYSYRVAPVLDCTSKRSEAYQAWEPSA